MRAPAESVGCAMTVTEREHGMEWEGDSSNNDCFPYVCLTDSLESRVQNK